MIILGLDPSTRCFGWGLIDLRVEGLYYLDSGAIKLRKHDQLLSRLYKLRAELLLIQCEIAAWALEKPISRNTLAALAIGQAAGIAHGIFGKYGPGAEHRPGAVKYALTGDYKASKEQVAASVWGVLGETIPYCTTDETDALAVAITHARKLQER